MRTARRWATRLPRKIDGPEAESLLAGDHTGADSDPLRALLAAAAGQPLPGELRGRDEVVAAYVHAARVAPQRPARRPRLAATLVRARTVKLAIALAVLLLGGVASAARDGVLPAPIQNAAHDLLSAVGVPPAGDHGHTSGPDDQNDDQPDATPPPTPSDGDDATDLEQLCRSYVEAHRDEDGLDPDDLASLAKAAGGSARIDDFCARYLATGSPQPSAEVDTTPTADNASSQDQTEPNPDGNG